MQFGLQENISLPLIFIDGITRCGKTGLCGIISSLKNMEMIQFPDEIELIIPGVSLGAISADYAKAFLRIYFNQLSYNINLSRKVNFRPHDISGVDNYSKPEIYYNRLGIGEGDEIVDKCVKKINSLPLLTHDLMVNLDCLNKMDLNYKMLELWRHPIDNIYSWWTRGWGERFGSDPRQGTLLVSMNETLYPWYGVGYESELSGYNAMEKCVKMATDLLDRACHQYYESTQKERIHILTFEDFCNDPDHELKAICGFLNTEITEYTPRYLKSTRFPRQLDIAERNHKLDEFRNGISSCLYKLLLDYSESYETDLYGIR